MLCTQENLPQKLVTGVRTNKNNLPVENWSLVIMTCDGC